jgi:O-antigen/teichoic acid export membrane protein
MTAGRFIKGTAAAAVDQALLSGVNLLIGLAFIRYAGKSEYGIYAQLFAALLLTASVQNALVCAPLNALAPKRDAAGRDAMLAGFFWVQNIVAVLSALLFFSVIQIVSGAGWFAGLNTEIALAFAAALVGMWVREYVRTVCFLESEPRRALMVDLTYGIGVLSGLAWVYHRRTLDVAQIFWIAGAANLAAVVVASVWYRALLRYPTGGLTTSISQAWSCGRWALPGAVVTWGFSNVYLYIAATLLGVAAAADLSASRLFLVPVGLCFVAWSRVYIPHASRWFGGNRLDRVSSTAKWSAISLSLLVIGYVAVLYAVYGWLETHVLGPSYRGLLIPVLLWGGYFLLNGVRGVGTNNLLGAERFKELFHYSAMAFAFSLPLMFLLTPALGTPGTLLGLIVAEALLVWLIWRKGWAAVKREYA